MKNNLLFARLSALAAGLLIGVIRFLIAKYAGYEFSLIVVLLGAVVGGALSGLTEDIEPSRDTAMRHGILAVLATILVIIAVRYAMRTWILKDPSYPFMDFFVDEIKVMDKGAIFLIIFYAIALYTAFITAFNAKDPDALKKQAEEAKHNENISDNNA
ncbi:MAG: hypothetical protein Q4B28_06305 [bacterium]|nr:hypothetical protein [bacterium]